jgi:hypothetical protein
MTENIGNASRSSGSDTTQRQSSSQQIHHPNIHQMKVAPRDDSRMRDASACSQLVTNTSSGLGSSCTKSGSGSSSDPNRAASNTSASSSSSPDIHRPHASSPSASSFNMAPGSSSQTSYASSSSLPSISHKSRAHEFDFMIQVFDLFSGQLIRSLRGPASSRRKTVRSLLVVGSRLLSAGEDGEIQIWQ